MTTLFRLLVALVLLVKVSIFTASAGTLYVSLDSPNPAPPYNTWATAAKIIQQAVDEATAGDEIVVTNGIYATGGRAVGTNLSVSRVAVDKPLLLRSLNGPQFTVIQGKKAFGGGNGDGAIRCVYLTDGASLTGFTLTNGATPNSGDQLIDQYGGGVWCASTNASLTNCVIAGNSAWRLGGGTCGGTLNNCTLTGNSANDGGGACDGELNNCTLTGNSAGDAGGGAYGGTLNNCTLTGNWSDYSGGGAYGGYGGTLNNCTLTGNSAYDGGGACDSELNNCTLTHNSADDAGGGAYGGTLNNCIVYFNTAPNAANYDLTFTMNYCCTTPLPQSGVGNLSVDPQLASTSHLSASSPCRGAGSASYTTGTDIDGEAWANPPSIGCDEFHVGAVTGPLSVSLVAAFTNVAVGVSVAFTASVQGRTTESRWDFGDVVVATNEPCVTHAWTAPGAYLVTLLAYNETQPDGVSATVAVQVFSEGVLQYVAADSANPRPPYTSWGTAARSIQDAVDVIVAGAQVILVSNGVYSTGGRAVYGTLTNRVAVTRPVSLLSVNGPQFTIIQGRKAPGGGNGDGAIRCVYLTNGASLTGFTLTNGATRCSGDDVIEQSGGGVCCASSNVALTNCVIAGNSAYYNGGGAYIGDCSTLNNCTLTGNWANLGGGAYTGASSALNNCTLTGNSASDDGGGVWCGDSGGTLNNCTLTGNSATSGGGVSTYWGTLNNCTLTGNSASDTGGGADLADYGTLNNCTLTANSANCGGAAYSGRLNNCTLTANSASLSGGGAFGGLLNNCIVWYNTASKAANYDWNTLNYCCTTPLPQSGVGNLSLDPQLASTSHLSAGSPCRGAGSASYTTGTDIDGEAWANPPSIGCDEFHVGAVMGPLSVSVVAAFTNVAVGVSVAFTASVQGRTTESRWDFGDGVIATNEPYVTHAWTAPGVYLVTLLAYNETQPDGVSGTVVVHVSGGVQYVAAGSANPTPPYTSWGTAARSIQDAVDVMVGGSQVILVSNGVYSTGGRAVYGTLTNRVAVTRPVSLRSVNGPQFTIIQGRKAPGGGNGDGAIRCVYLTNGASLTGFTLTNGATRTVFEILQYRESAGGGLWCEAGEVVVSNCVVAGNSALENGGGAYNGTLNNCTLSGNSANDGGGAYSGTLNNCTLIRNSANDGGGGASWATLSNCTLIRNSAFNGGGASESELNNCTLTNNSASYGGAAYYGTLNDCTLIRNSAGEGGGGGAWCTLNRCVLADNTAVSGGGTYYGALNNCMLVGNQAMRGGGTSGGTLNNCTLADNSATDSFGGAYLSTLNDCIVWYNTAPNAANYDSGSILNYCCTTPLLTNGVGNITKAPLFVDHVGGNLRLQSNSPCINAGLNAYSPGPIDLDGYPRIVSGTIDIGAYEYQGGGSVISYAWLQQYGLPTNGSADFTDPDRDGMNNWQEWICGTNPTNALSVLRLVSPLLDGTNLTLRWQSVAGVRYSLDRTTGLGPLPPFLTLATNILGQTGITTFRDTSSAAEGRAFYRVGVQK